MNPRITLAALAAILTFAGGQAAAAKPNHSAAYYRVDQYCGARICGYAAPRAAHVARTRHRHRSHQETAETAPSAPAGLAAHTIKNYPGAPPLTKVSPTARARGIVRVETAAGIAVLVASSFATKAQAVIADLVAAGYSPRRLGGYSWSPHHVRNSLHHSGRAVDVDQCGWGCTSAPRQTLRMIVARHGLRDGCEFRDSGHFDDGPHVDVRRIRRNCGAAYAAIVTANRYAAATP